MKKIYILLFAIVAFNASTVLADNFNIITSGLTYSPASLNVVVGDQITISASGSHPLQQVSEATWTAQTSTPLPGGFGPETSAYTFTVTEAGVIYYVCANHVGSGMKGMITVSTATEVSTLASANKLQIFPTVVADGSFSVKTGSETIGATLEIYNVNGQLVESFILESETQQLNATLAAGTYSAILRKNDNILFRERMVFVGKN